MKKTMIVSFSGGRSSAYMCQMLINNYSEKYNFIFIYANTSQEHPKTLEFVNNIDKEFGLNLVWLEAKVIHGERKSTTFTITDYKNCKRNGEVFEEVIIKYGLPNVKYLHCTRELKQRPIKSYVDTLNLDDYIMALGIRGDEPKRIKDSSVWKDICYPLAEFDYITKEDVLKFWKLQAFDLDLPEHLGNCTWCYKKSNSKLELVARDYPKAFDFPRKMEEKYKFVKSDIGRHIFRSHKDVNSFFDCGAEECGSML